MLCECGDPKCKTIVMIGLDEYRALRADRLAFLTAPGHSLGWADSQQANLDLLACFSEGERAECSKCGKRAVVSLPDALASFCLACGVIWIDGQPNELTARAAA